MKYSWKRFLYPREGTIDFDHEGFVEDPDSKYGKYANSDFKTFEELRDCNCIVLLGEPGIGKSFVLNEEFNALETNSNQDYHLIFNLNEFETGDNLKNRIFSDEKFNSWKKGDSKDSKLFLFLDALDECGVNINSVISILSSEFNKFPKERFFLRIACRVADWPKKIEELFNNKWDKEKVALFGLTPLRKVDVMETLDKNSINHDDFFEELKTKKAVPLAIRPNTLQFLIDTYLKHEELSNNKFDLYLEGCDILCKELNEDRYASRNIGHLEPNERLIIASRIAAAMIFSNKKAIWAELTFTGISEEFIKIEDFTGGKEVVNGNDVKVDIKAIHDTLRTGLFNGRPNGYEWSHQTFAEFLAAYYMIYKEVPVDKIMDIITNPFFTENEILTDLKETITWISEKNSSVFSKLVDINPDVLLGTDLDVDDDIKSLIVDNLLNLFENEKLRDDYSLSTNYYKLNHPKISEQLVLFIKDAGKNFFTRLNAIRIAEACGLSDLPEILEVSLDESEDLNLRVKACYAISKKGSKDSREKLRTLIDVDEDVDDELKGYALRATWPELITAEDLFKVLTPPKKSHFTGGYSTFIYYYVTPNLKPQDFPFALKWIANNCDDIGFKFDRLAYEILINAWDYLEECNLYKEYARAILVMTEENSLANRECTPKLNDKIKSNDKNRRELIKYVADLYSPNEINILKYSDIKIILDEDIPWMFDYLSKSESPEIANKLTVIIKTFFSIHKKDHRDALKKFKETHILPTDLKDIPIANYEEKMLEAKTKLQNRELQETQKKQMTFMEDYAEKIKYIKFMKKILNEIESENLDEWIRLNIELALGTKTRIYHDNIEADLTSLIGWDLLGKQEHERILNSAKKYIVDRKSDSDKWLGTDKYYLSDLAAYRAIRLIYNKDTDFLRDISKEMWENWIPIILVYPVDDPSKDMEIKNEILKLAYEKAHAKAINTLKIIIPDECKKNDFITVLHVFDGIWDDELDDALLDLLGTCNFSEPCLRNILDFMLENKSTNIRSYIEDMLESKSTESPEVISACTSLLLHSKDAGWGIIWPNIDNNGLGKKIIPSISHLWPSDTTFMEKLNENELADLFIWMEKNFPKKEDPDSEGFISTREEVGHFRDSILRYLENIGTSGSLTAIEKIMEVFPEKKWLPQIYLEAKENTNRNKWKPYFPTEIIKITNDNHLYLVQSEYQLVNVIFESLSRLETLLHGETRVIQFLWNQDKDKNPTMWPVWENQFSDFVKLFLETDLQNRGIIINREVQISKGSTDIHIDCITEENGKKESIKTIIETKGCWNKELNYAMEKQLLDNYIKHTHANTGIYLVGWFYCDDWKEDYRKKATPKMDLEEAREQFRMQAEKLSKDEIQIRAYVMDTRMT